jgi:hypothetical protein
LSAIFSIRRIGLSMICLSFVKQLNLLRRRYGANYNRIGKIKYINCLPCLRPVTWTLNKLLKIVFLTFWQVKWNIAVNWPIITQYGYWLCFILLLRIFISLLSLLLVGFWCCSYIQIWLPAPVCWNCIFFFFSEITSPSISMFVYFDIQDNHHLMTMYIKVKASTGVVITI